MSRDVHVMGLGLGVRGVNTVECPPVVWAVFVCSVLKSWVMVAKGYGLVKPSACPGCAACKLSCVVGVPVL